MNMHRLGGHISAYTMWGGQTTHLGLPRTSLGNTDSPATQNPFQKSQKCPYVHNNLYHHPEFGAMTHDHCPCLPRACRLIFQFLNNAAN